LVIDSNFWVHLVCVLSKVKIVSVLNYAPHHEDVLRSEGTAVRIHNLDTNGVELSMWHWY